MKVSTILEQIDLGAMALPTFQRGYVWNRDQVRGLMYSLYHRHPIGSLLIWSTRSEDASTRGKGEITPGVVELLLDGQQRITSLYGIIRGVPPEFFDGNKDAFTGLYFNLDDEVFEFFAPMKMNDNPRWINVTDLMKSGVGSFIQKIMKVPDIEPDLDMYINRLNAVDGIKTVDLHIDKVTGPDKTVDVVVDIFNRVNSGGTKLSKGDLALAKICSEWPGARIKLKSMLNKWQKAGFNFRLEWLLRCATTFTTNGAFFSGLRDVSTVEFQKSLPLVEKYIDNLLVMISSRLGLDHDRVLGSRYSFPLMVRYLKDRDGKLDDYKERDKLLYWYINTFLWGRYAGSTESVLSQDLEIIKKTDTALDGLIEHLRRNRGDLKVNPNDFKAWGKGARFYPVLYMMTRIYHAKDWDTGIELTDHMLGKLQRLEIHHVFPKSQLYKAGYSKSEVNALANFTFLTQETNLIISDRLPEEYLPETAQKHPGALESHWMPIDPGLWKIENYLVFLTERQKLLAKSFNKFLDGLFSGMRPELVTGPSVLEREAPFVLGSIEGEEEERLLLDIRVWLEAQGLPEGELPFELIDEKTGELLASLDLAWSTGLQEGLSQPVALLINETKELEELVNSHGFRFFTNVLEFKQYVLTEILTHSTEQDQAGGILPAFRSH